MTEKKPDVNETYPIKELREIVSEKAVGGHVSIETTKFSMMIALLARSVKYVPPELAREIREILKSSF